jgi:hypothetical protein
VNGGNAVAQAKQDIRQHDRIDTAAQSDQDLILLPEQPVVLDEFTYRLDVARLDHALAINRPAGRKLPPYRLKRLSSSSIGIFTMVDRPCGQAYGISHAKS